MWQRFKPAVLLLSAAFVLGGLGCESMPWSKKKDSERSSSSTAKAGTSANSLYTRLGGEPAIRKVVDDFVQLAAADPQVNFTRKGHPNEWEATPENIRALKERLVEFIGMATGGPQKYTGADMVSSHTGMNITEAEFNAAAADLQRALEKNNVPKPLQDELLTVVATTKKDIVGK